MGQYGWRLGLLIFLVAAGGWVLTQTHFFSSHTFSQSASHEASQKSQKSGKSGEPDIPVITAAVVRQDVPLYLSGLGSVTAFYTVTVKPQVDGQLTRVVFKEGQDVRRGEVLAYIDPRPFTIQWHQAQASLARDTAQLRNARLNLERMRVLVSQRLIAKQNLDNQKSLVEQLEATVLSDQAQVDHAQLQLTYATITSPIQGRTGMRLVDPGTILYAHEATGIVVITQMDPIHVVFTLPEDDVPRLIKAMAQSTLTADAFSRDDHTKLGTGQLALMDNQINTATGTIRLKAVFSNPKRRLWPNQFVKVRLHMATLNKVLVVPAMAIQQGPQGHFAYVMGQDHTVQPRPVNIASFQGDQAVVQHGLNPGEQVVVEGQYQLHSGSRVISQPPAAQTSHPTALSSEGKPDR